mgnify:FL=1
MMKSNPMEMRIANASDIDGVIRLQQQYHISSIKEAERSQGFVTTAFTKQQLNDLIEQENGLFVATDNGEIVAYLMTASWNYWSSWPVQAHMMSILEHYVLDDSPITLDNSYQYGPICIASAYRGGGLLRAFFDFTLRTMAARYPILVTFVNKINLRSMAAHVDKLGLKELGEFEVNGNRYAWLGCFTDARAHSQKS